MSEMIKVKDTNKVMDENQASKIPDTDIKRFDGEMDVTA